MATANGEPTDQDVIDALVLERPVSDETRSAVDALVERLVGRD